jgi:hypothetical protein
MSEFIYTVKEIFDSENREGCLNQNKCDAFIIPSYQRGYKWGSEEEEPVDQLFQDLYKAWIENANEYLLQAITVKKNPKLPVLEVIDGQQRLTTLYILLHVLSFQSQNVGHPVDKLKYCIRHKKVSLDNLVTNCLNLKLTTTGTFEDFKTSINVKDEKSQDDYYLKCAVLRCFYELNCRKLKVFDGPDKVGNFKHFIISKTKLLVNVVEPHIEGAVLFGNLNSNRVLLTETELIKGLLLTKVARETTSKRPRQYREILERRIYLGRKWDEIHRWANQEEICSLYFPAFIDNDGMTGLLKLVSIQMPSSTMDSSKKLNAKYPLFEYFLGCPHLDPIFDLLTSTYATLADWHEYTHDYNLLGYVLLRKFGNNIRDPKRLEFLAKLLCLETKKEVTQRLLDERKKLLCNNEQVIDIDLTIAKLKTLDYDEDKEQIHNILLALSVFREEENAGRFDFYAYYKEDWTLEHIFPQTPFGKNQKLSDAQINKVYDVLGANKELLSEDTVQEIDQIKASSIDETIKREKTDEILKRVRILDRIGNLCLLRREDNSSMSCGMFDDKRKRIRDRIAKGSFVPLHTYEVFSKMIVGEDTGLDVWCKTDICNHENKISARLEKLIKEVI